MAVTKIWDVRGRLDKLINYVVNPKKTADLEYSATYHSIKNVIEYDADALKTEEHLYVTGINCDENNAVREFMNAKRKWKKLGGIVAFHGYQSFAENEVDAQTAHEIGVKLAERLWGDRFQVVVTTHCNTGHYHNHFALNSVSYNDGKRYYDNKATYRLMREESDRLCKEYGLSVIEHPSDKGMHYAEWKAEQEGQPTLRGVIRQAIDKAIRGALTEEHFFDAMDQMGFVIDQSGKYPKIKQVGNERFVRFKSLGEGYSLDEIFERVHENERQMFPRIPKQENPKQIFDGESEPVALMTYVPLYRCYHRALVLIKERPKTNRRIYFLIRQDTSAMRLYEDAAKLVSGHNLHTKDDVLKYKEYAMNQIDKYTEERKEARNALKRAQRSGDTDLYNQTKYNIGVLTRRLSKLRREVTTCDEVIDRSQHVKDNLLIIEQGKFKGKESIRDEHISRRGGSGRENDP